MRKTQSQLKSQLIRQTINETTLYYSLVKKQGKNISFLSNDRLLIYDNTRKIIFYNNDFKNTPFRTNIPNPKNDTFTPLQSSTFKNPNNTNEVQVRYTGKNVKGELETIEWNFICENQHLAKEWMRLFEEEKNRIVSQVTGEKGAGFIHDTLLDAISKNKPVSPPKESILKPEERMIKTNPLQEQQSNIQNSRMSSTKKYELPKEEIINRSLKKSEIGQSQPMLNSHLPEHSILRSSKNIEESRLSMQASQTKRVETSNIKQKDPSIYVSRDPSQVSIKKKQNYDDWNHIFLRNSHESTVLQFEQAALRAFRAIWDRDSNVLSDERRVYESQGLRISVCNAFTEDARLLKRQFRNYHFIIESCKAKLIIGVPLTCLIEWQGVVALAKAPLPEECEEVLLSRLLSEVRELQRYTRIGNGILEKAVLYDATELYGMNGDKRLIYVDGLVEYLPLHVNEYYCKSSLRPEYLLDNVTQIVPGGDVKPINRQEWKTINTVCEGMQNCIKELASHLNNQQTLWSHALQLKSIFHDFGVNFKCLPRVYNELTNKYVKKYIQTVMAAKVAKDLITETLLDVRTQNQLPNPSRLVQECFRKFLQGNNSSSSELWKDLSVKFKKMYGITFNNGEILAGFFLNSLIKLLRVNCDVSKLNKSKKMFKEEGIIGPGFVVSLEPKSKIYNRFTTQFIEKIKYACKEEKKDEEIYDEIVQTLHLDKNILPFQYSQGQSNQCILEYLSYYTPPKNLDPNIQLKNIPIYNDVLKEPPSAFTLKLTKTYLNWCIKKQKGDDFKKGMENALKIADFWLEETHIYHCSLYEQLSDFYASLGNGQESINFMKEALSRCIRVCGAQSKQAGAKYYELGERQLKVGHKKSALQNFSKAKINMESNQNQTIKYPQLLMRLSALHLNNGNIESCIEGALQAIKQFEQYDKRSNTSGALTEGYKIKTFEVLSRAFEISGKKQELKDMAILCAKKFNRTRSQWAFQQMLRICLAAAIFRNAVQKCEIFLKFTHKILQQEKVQEHVALKQLMNLSEGMVIMQRFISRFQSIEKIISQGTSKRGYSPESKDYVLICKWLANCVGQDYIQGLVQQKQFE